MRPSFLASLLLLLPLNAQDLLVASRFTDQVLRYDPAGAFVSVFASGGGLVNPVGLTYGPDGHLYVSSGNTNQVLRYDGTTGAFIDVFASGGGLLGPRNLNFGPDGHLYVCSGSTNEVLRYDGATGVFMGVFASLGLNGPTSLTFGPDGNLWVGSVISSRVFSYSGVTGQFLSVIFGVNGPHDLSFGPDRMLWVSNVQTGHITRHHPWSGLPLGAIVTDPSLVFPLGLTWEEDGSLLVANQGADEVRRYDGVTGALLGVKVASGAGGLDGPLFAILSRDPAGPTLNHPPSGVGGDVVVATSGLRPGTLAGTAVGFLPGVLGIGTCPGQAMGMLDPIVLWSGPADESGRFIFRQAVPSWVAGMTLYLQTLDVGTCTPSNLVVHVP